MALYRCQLLQHLALSLICLAVEPDTDFEWHTVGPLDWTAHIQGKGASSRSAWNGATRPMLRALAQALASHGQNAMTSTKVTPIGEAISNVVRTQVHESG